MASLLLIFLPLLRQSPQNSPQPYDFPHSSLQCQRSNFQCRTLNLQWHDQCPPTCSDSIRLGCAAGDGGATAAAAAVLLLQFHRYVPRTSSSIHSTTLSKRLPMQQQRRIWKSVHIFPMECHCASIAHPPRTTSFVVPVNIKCDEPKANAAISRRSASD